MQEHRRSILSYGYVVLLSIIALLSACSGEPKIVQVEVTKEVPVTVEVTKEVPVTVEVTRIVTPTSLPTPTSPPYAPVIPENWESYSLINGKASFAYPADWTKKSEKSGVLFLTRGLGRRMVIVSPDACPQDMKASEKDTIRWLKTLVGEMTSDAVVFLDDGQIESHDSPYYVTYRSSYGEYEIYSIGLLTYATDGRGCLLIQLTDEVVASLADDAIPLVTDIAKSVEFDE